MAQYIDKDALVAEVERRIKSTNNDVKIGAIESFTVSKTLNSLISFINTLEVKDVDLEKESELIANGIMISVQSNKYGTNIYNTQRNDFNHYHLQMAARKGIELGIKAQKGE